jgi:hypothetical protein
MKSAPIRWTRDFLGSKCPCGSDCIADTCCWKGDGCWEKTPVGIIAVKETQLSNPSCYLSCMSNCTSKITKEHFVSRTILEQLTKGGILHFQNAAHFFGGKSQVEIGIDSFAAKVLCDNHNSALSSLDAAAGAAFQRIECLAKDLVHAENGHGLNSFHVVSGIDVERWMVKVYCGLVAAGKIRSASGRITQPSVLNNELLTALMGTTSLQPPLGLYMHTSAGQITRPGLLSFGTIQLSDGSDSVGGLVLSLGLMNLVLVTSQSYAQTFREPSWYRHQTLAFNAKHKRSRIRFLFTY